MDEAAFKRWWYGEGQNCTTTEARCRDAWQKAFEQEREKSASMLAALRYYRDECTGAEPSLSVFDRMVDAALQESRDV